MDELLGAEGDEVTADDDIEDGSEEEDDIGDDLEAELAGTNVVLIKSRHRMSSSSFST